MGKKDDIKGSLQYFKRGNVSGPLLTPYIPLDLRGLQDCLITQPEVSDMLRQQIIILCFPWRAPKGTLHGSVATAQV